MFTSFVFRDTDKSSRCGNDDAKDDTETAKKRLDAVKKYVDVGKDIRRLDNVVESLKDSLGVK